MFLSRSPTVRTPEVLRTHGGCANHHGKILESFAARDHTPAGHIDLIGALGNMMGAEDNRNGPRP